MSNDAKTPSAKSKMVRVRIANIGGTCAINVYPNPESNRFFYCNSSATSGVVEDDGMISFRCNEHRGHLSRDERVGELVSGDRIVTEIERRED